MFRSSTPFTRFMVLPCGSFADRSGEMGRSVSWIQGRRLKIPIWMLLLECAEITISPRPHLGKQALLSLASLITSQLDSKDPVHANLRQTRVRGFEGGRRGATSTSGPDDPKGMRCPANRRSEARRSDRSH